MDAAPGTAEAGSYAGAGSSEGTGAQAPARHDEIADFYDARTGQSVTDPATAALLELAGDVGGLRLLDLACGPGRVARELARRGARVTGLDISAVLLRKGQAAETGQPFRIDYVHSDATLGGALYGELFDGVACNYGLSDIDDLDGLLATVARASNTGFRGKVGSNHRTLSSYLNALIGHGLTLERVAEPPPHAAWLQRLPGAAPVPQYLVGRCRRG